MVKTIFLFMFLFALGVQALPSQGYWIPRSKVLSFGELKYDLQVQQNPEKGKPNQLATATGVASGFIENGMFYGEAGLDWREPTRENLLKGITVHGKVAYQNVKRDGWAIAVGADRFAAQEGQHDFNMFYTNLEMSIGSQWMVLLGGFTGHEQRIVEPSGVMAGVWRKIQNDRGDIGIEWMSGQGPLGYIVPGLRVEVRDGFEATLAYAVSGSPENYRNLFLTKLTVYF